MTQTMNIRGENIPIVLSANYLIQFGPTSKFARDAFMGQYQKMLHQAQGELVPGYPAPLDMIAFGYGTGRMVVRLWATDPDAVVARAAELMDGDGPRIEAL